MYQLFNEAADLQICTIWEEEIFFLQDEWHKSCVSGVSGISDLRATPTVTHMGAQWPSGEGALDLGRGTGGLNCLATVSSKAKK